MHGTLCKFRWQALIGVVIAMGCATPTLCAQFRYTYSTDPATIEYDPATGIGSTEVVIRLRENVPSGSVPLLAEAVSFSLSHDPALIESAVPTAAGILLTLNGGSGPQVNQCTSYPSGINCGWVFSILNQSPLQFPTDLEIGRFTLSTVSAAWMGNLTGGTALLDPASPPEFEIPDTVALGNDSFPAEWDFAPVTLVAVSPSGFLRGDANLDTALNVADVISILSGLFVVGETLVCPAASDANDDDAVDIADPISVLNFIFGGGGAPPPAPFPDCGGDPTPSGLPCDAFAC